MLTDHDYIVAAVAVRRYRIRPTVINRHLKATNGKDYKLYEALRLIDSGNSEINSISKNDIDMLLCGIHERLIRCRQAALLFASSKYTKDELKKLLKEDYWKYYHAFAGMKHAAKASKVRKVNTTIFREISIPTPGSGKAKLSIDTIIQIFKTYTAKQIAQHTLKEQTIERYNWRPSNVTRAAIKRLKTAGLTLEDMALPYEAIKNKAIEFYFIKRMGIEAADIDDFLRDVYEKGTRKANLREYKWLTAYKKFRYLFIPTFSIPAIKTFDSFKALSFTRAWSVINYGGAGVNLSLSLQKGLSKAAVKKEEIPNTEVGVLYLLRKIGRLGYKEALNQTHLIFSYNKNNKGFRFYQFESFLRSVGLTANTFKLFLRQHDISNIQSITELRRLVPQQKKEPPRITDNYLPQIKALMRQKNDGVQIFGIVKQQGYIGSLVTLQRCIRKIREKEVELLTLFKKLHIKISEI